MMVNRLLIFNIKYKKRNIVAKIYRKNGSEISPCIIAQVRFALGITHKKPKNNKTCSENYWNEVALIFAKKYIKKYQTILL